jgi:hypothetical protein
MKTYTIWLCISPSSAERKIIARPARVDDRAYQHEYQRILGHVSALNETSAIEAYYCRA